MNKPLIHSPLNSTLRLASAAGLMLVLAGSSARAQTTQLLAPPASGTTTVTDPYFDPDTDTGFISGPLTVNAGTNAVTFTATATSAVTALNPNPISFETFTENGELNFPTGTELIDTFDSQNPTGPLLINFSTGVNAFGITAQDDALDTETFTFSVYNGTTLLGTFVTPPVDQTAKGSSGTSIFLGAQSVGISPITSVLISSASVATNGGAPYTGGSNDFYVGPLSIYSAAPVPEASTTVSFGLLLALGLGGALVSTRKKMAAKQASAA